MYIIRQLGSARLTAGNARFGAMFSIKPQMKIHYFDRNIIKTRWRRMNKNPLHHAGALVMRIARGSIRRRTKLRGKPSRPGSPPFSRQPGKLPPFKQIFWKPFNLGTSVIVGMVGYGGQPAVPGLHEHGGIANRKVFIDGGRRRTKSGQYGRKRIIYKTKAVRYPQRPFMTPALWRARQRLPQLWAMSLSSS